MARRRPAGQNCDCRPGRSRSHGSSGCRSPSPSPRQCRPRPRPKPAEWGLTAPDCESRCSATRSSAEWTPAHPEPPGHDRDRRCRGRTRECPPNHAPNRSPQPDTAVEDRRRAQRRRPDRGPRPHRIRPPSRVPRNRRAPGAPMPDGWTGSSRDRGRCARRRS